MVLYYEDGKSNTDYREDENIRLSVPKKGRNIGSVRELEKILR